MIGVISDIHANKVALDTVISDMPEEVERIICCGDIIGYGPSPRECVDSVMDTCDIVIKGNHEKKLLSDSVYNSPTARAGLEHAQEELYSEHFEYIQKIPESIVEEEFQLIHNHPNSGSMLHVYEEDIVGMFSPYFERGVFIYGHTHVPVNGVFEGVLVVNPGSVGQPRDGDNRASYALIDMGDREAEIHRVSYDIEETIENLDKNDFPEESANRLREGV